MPPELQQKLIEEYNATLQEAKAATTQRKSVIVTDKGLQNLEIYAELDKRAAKVRRQRLSKERYDKLAADLDESFTSTQLLRYLRHKRSPFNIRDGKPHKIDVILKQVWQVEKIKTPRNETYCTLAVPRKSIFFLTRNGGELLKNLSTRYNAKIKLDDLHSSFVITTKLPARVSISDHLKEFSQTIKTVELAMPAWDISHFMDPDVMLALNVHMEAKGDILHLSYIGDDSSYHRAIRAIYAYSDVQGSTAPRRLIKHEQVDLCSMPIDYNNHLLLKGPQTWIRSVADVRALRLPHYITSSNDPRPIFGHQVGNRIRVTQLDSTVLLEDNTSLKDLLLEYIATNTSEKGSTELSFGYALGSKFVIKEKSEAVPQMKTFTSDIPGLNQVLKTLVPLATQPTMRHVMYFARNTSDYLSDKQVQDFAQFKDNPVAQGGSIPAQLAELLRLSIDLDTVSSLGTPYYSVDVVNPVLDPVISLSNHHADLKVSSIHPLAGQAQGNPSDEEKQAIERFIGARKFDNYTKVNVFPNILQLGDRTWFMWRSELVKSLLFRPPSLHACAQRATVESLALAFQRSNDPEACQTSPDTPSDDQLHNVLIEWSLKKRNDDGFPSSSSLQELKIIINGLEEGDKPVADGKLPLRTEAAPEPEPLGEFVWKLVVELMQILDRPQ